MPEEKTAFDSSARANEKQRSRAADESALASGLKTRAELEQENSAFRRPATSYRPNYKAAKVKF